jgi:hypothetical protein
MGWSTRESSGLSTRTAQWLVDDVIPPATPRDSAIVRLACADDDNQGHTLDVFRDCEPDRDIIRAESWQAPASRGFDPADREALRGVTRDRICPRVL